MPKYWGKQIFTHGSFPEVGQKQKMERKRKRLNDGNNNGQLQGVSKKSVHFCFCNFSGPETPRVKS